MTRHHMTLNPTPTNPVIELRRVVQASRNAGSCETVDHTEYSVTNEQPPARIERAERIRMHVESGTVDAVQ